MRPQPGKRSAWAWLAVVATGIAILIGAQAYFAHITDQATSQREQSVVETGIESLIREFAEKSSSVTIWDEAVENLDNDFNPAWADTNVGAFFRDNGYEGAWVVDTSNALLYSMPDAAQDLPPPETIVSTASGLLSQIRAAETARGPVEAVLARQESVSDSINSSAVHMLGNRPFVLTASLVQPDFGTALPQGAQAPVVLTARPLDESFVQTITDRFLLEKSHLHTLADDKVLTPLKSDEGRIPLRDGLGQTVAAFDWHPQQPGRGLMLQTMPPILLALLALAGWGGRLYLRQRSAHEGLIASEARAAHMAYHDSLTGLANRALLSDRLAHALAGVRRSGNPFAVHFIDLDRFKEVNDTHGHETGDALIRAVAGQLSKACRQVDTLARLGGDEFAIIQVDATPETMAQLADRIVSMLAEPIDLPVGRLFIGCSIGITLARDGNLEPAELLRQADLALYRAKDQGRGKFVFFDPDMDSAMRTRRALQDDLRIALEEGRLDVHYQPQVNARGETVGLEALVRWEHATRGSISPSVFVPLAEECGLIEALGTFTMRRAFTDSRRWPHLKVAVNVSAAQLRRRDFCQRLEALVAELGVDPRNFEIEITEGLLLGDDTQTHASLNAIRGMGFQIALDDFGTGYSSLSYLQKYPIDKIKIDRSFITNLGIEDEADAVVHAIVRLARALGLHVIAEGVETENQRSHLNAVGCGNVQGYLFGKAVSADEIVAIMQTGPKPRVAA